jgi:uncharacterized protein DUF4136
MTAMVRRPPGRRRVLLPVILAIAVAAGIRAGAAKTEINADFDPSFSYAGLRTWAWHPEGAGDVKMLIADVDAKRVAGRVEPILVPALERELAARGFTKTTGAADLYVHYYVLAGVGTESQYMGQFVAPVPEWGLPLFAPVTTSLEIFATGTLIVDVTSPVKKAIVWRGSAQRKIDLEKPDAERRTVLERAVRDLLKKFPPPPGKKK